MAHFDASRLKVKPMAIGWIPPDFLFSAKRRSPKKTGEITEGQPPAKTRLANAVRALRNSGPASRHISKSRMCWGRRRSGPPPEPTSWKWQDSFAYLTFIHRYTLLRLRCRQICQHNTLEDGGCFSRRALTASGEGAAGLSSDIRRRTAVLTLPSSSFADTAWLIVEVELVCRRGLSTGLANSRSGWTAEYVEIRSLMADVRLWRFPPLFGAWRTVCPQLKSSNHRIWIWVRNSFTQQCRQVRGKGSPSRFGNMFDNWRVGWRPYGCRSGNINRWSRVGGISTLTGRGLISWDLRLAACLEWWLIRPWTRIVTSSMPVERAITIVYLPDCQT